MFYSDDKRGRVCLEEDIQVMRQTLNYELDNIFGSYLVRHAYATALQLIANLDFHEINPGSAAVVHLPNKEKIEKELGHTIDEKTLADIHQNMVKGIAAQLDWGILLDCALEAVQLKRS